MIEVLEPKWISCFEDFLRLSGVAEGDLIGVLAESQSRPVLVELTEHALSRIGARGFRVTVRSPVLQDPLPVRSTGATYAYDDYPEVMAALGACSLVVDCTVEGLLHSKARQSLLGAGGRVLMISNEHPEVLERCRPDPAVHELALKALAILDAGSTMRVTSEAGTNLTVDITGAPSRGGGGILGPDDKIAYWPAGLCLCFPLPNSTNGTVVLDVGDINLTFKRYIESPVHLTVADDRVTSIDGDGLDAQLMRTYYEGWDDPNAYAVSHVGWGVNPGARWDSLTMYDREDINGTEMRAIAGSFLFSTGANEFADRFTNCHFDLPMRNCTVTIDGVVVVDQGRLVTSVLS
ncbi:MAG: peptidase M29 [Actinomycetota bacterium]